MRKCLILAVGLLCALTGCGSLQSQTGAGSSDSDAKLMVISQMVAEAPTWARKICVEEENIEKIPVVPVLFNELEKRKINSAGKDLIFGSPFCTPANKSNEYIVITYFSGAVTFVKSQVGEKERSEIDARAPGLRAAIEDGEDVLVAGYSYCGERIFSSDRNFFGAIRVSEWPTHGQCSQPKGMPVFVAVPKCSGGDTYLPGATPIDDERKTIIPPEHIHDACHFVRTEAGFSFDDDLISYDCGISFPSSNEKGKKLAADLDFSGPLSFGPPNEPLASGYQRNASTNGMVLVLATKSGDIKKVITNKTDLHSVRRISSAGAAIDFLLLNGQFDDWNLSHICEAWVVDEPGGWLFKNVPENCKSFERDISVTTSGEVSVGDLRKSEQRTCTVY